VLWLLEELGCRYQVQKYQRDPRTLLPPPELRCVHPPGKSPVITDEAHTLAESGAIIEYLIERYGNGALRPAAGSLPLEAAAARSGVPLGDKVRGSRASAPGPLISAPCKRAAATSCRERCRRVNLSWRAAPGFPAKPASPRQKVQRVGLQSAKLPTRCGSQAVPCTARMRSKGSP